MHTHHSLDHAVAGSAQSLIRLYRSLDDLVLVEPYARSRQPVEQHLIAPTVIFAQQNTANHSQLEWLLNNAGQPHTAELFLNLFYDEAEVVLYWRITDSVYTGWILTNNQNRSF